MNTYFALTIMISLAAGFFPKTFSVELIAINPDRLQLLKDALSWMTFRKNGKLMTDNELAPLFLDTLKLKYTTSKFYRTFVIAFQQGVLPRMTLQENQACDPAYTLQYKFASNYSVTWYTQKTFTFDSFYDSGNANLRQFCDYRQGLICNYNAKKCGCPEGAEMTPIEPGSSVKRCQLKIGEICALIDLDHGNDPTHPLLKKFIHQLIFNLERPPSCQSSSQCRFKKGEPGNYPKCVTGGPWNTQVTDLDFGDECAIGLLASPGSCKKRDEKPYETVTRLDGFVCYDHGPPRNLGTNGPGVETKVGFCSAELGPYGVAHHIPAEEEFRKEFDPLYAPFIHPRTVPLRGQALRDIFMKDVFHYTVYNCFFVTGTHDTQVESEGEACSVSKTATLEQAWTFFRDLEKTPPPGQEFVASEGEVRAKVQSIKDACLNPKERFCQVYSYQAIYEFRNRPSLKCVAEGSPDVNGNDGKCQKPGNVDLKAFDKSFLDYVLFAKEAAEHQYNQEWDYNGGILSQNPEPPCDPYKAEMSTARANHPEPLEGGYCPDGSVCYEDYEEKQSFQPGTCALESGFVQRFVCHDTSEKLAKCEGEYLQKKVQEAIQDVDKYGKLKEGAKCDYDFEKTIRENTQVEIEKINPYLLLNRIAIRGAICDKMGRNLECTSGGTCKCIGEGCTEPQTTKSTEGYNGATKSVVEFTWKFALVLTVETFFMN